MGEDISFLSRLKRIFVSATIILTIAGISSGLGVVSVVGFQVFFGDDTELKKSTILARINEETTLYTLDEETKIGSFFDNSHRSYIAIENIPAHMIRAMVASEDKNFYNHFGVDPTAIFLAFMEGVKNKFRFKRGGSTITQQTVKNILDRREHTFRRKFKEMIRALQLERLYPKRQILEFYLNQFHVTSNGKGVGIAAQYYFNKDVRDLNLVEAAFIAGSVKAPSKYNPFIKYTEKAKQKAWRLANQRKNYVLRRMYEQGWINKEELEVAWDEPVPFRKGKFRTREVALVSLIKGQLNKKEILEALNMDSIRELDHAGLKIYTTLDIDLQNSAQLAMRRNLSRLETILEGYSPEPKEKFRPLRSLEVGQFYYGKISKIVTRKKKTYIEVDFGLPKGIVPYESLVRTAKLLNLPTYKGYKHHLKEILDTIKVGDVIFTEVQKYDKDTHWSVLELKKYPRLNGGLIAVDKGEVRAVVAGFDAKGFNRAMFATKQPGSVFKTVAFFAAQQLGWSSLDRVDNQRRVFPFQGKFYYPRPDHISPYPEVSMLWAGVKSENLASIYLASNLLAKLNFGEFKSLMKNMGLLPVVNENAPDFHYRVAKETGVQLNNDGIKEHVLDRAIHDLTPDLVFSGNQKLLRKLKKMWWGRGYAAELKNIYSQPSKDISDKERNIRIQLLKNNYERFSILADEVIKDWDAISRVVKAGGAESAFANPTTRLTLSRFRVLSAIGSAPQLGYIRTLEGEDVDFSAMEKEDVHFTMEAQPGRELNPLDVQAIWGDAGPFGQKANISVTDVKLADYLPLGYFRRIASGLEQRFESVMQREGTYSLYQYFNHHDFRIILGLKYLVNLSKAMGVYSKLEPVPSFPLGTNDVSVAEVAKVYQTFVSGKTYKFYQDGPSNQLNFIRRIEDREGNILFEPHKDEFQLADRCQTIQTAEILRKVVTHGTGRRARGELQIPLFDNEQTQNKSISKKEKSIKIRIPAFGKTGTTNDYTTAYFAGFLPYPTQEKAPLQLESSYVIASYVGYDLNKTMRNGPYKISGAYGALPVWTDFAKELIKVKNYSEYLDKLDIDVISKRVWPLDVGAECTTRNLKVDLPRGTIVSAVRDNDIEIFGSTDIGREGENFVNEFARNPSVKSYVYLPLATQTAGLRGSVRDVKFFNDRDKEQEAKENGGGIIEIDSDNDQDLDGGSLHSEFRSSNIENRGLRDNANKQIDSKPSNDNRLQESSPTRQKEENKKKPQEGGNNPSEGIEKSADGDQLW